MKAFVIFAVGGPILVLTKFSSVMDPQLLKKTATWGKFIAYEVPLDSVKAAYSAHFEHILADPKQTDDLRILDTDSDQIFTNLDFKQFGMPVVSQPD